MEDFPDYFGDQLDEVYQERNALVAFLSGLYDGVLVEDSEDCPGWGIVYIETEFGQMSWHIPTRDFHLFGNARRLAYYPWDKHSTEEKYKRLKELTDHV